MIRNPVSMNIELTTNCPLRCPQCYCSLTGGKNIDLDKAIYWIKEAGKIGVTDVMLSGGETLCYPYLYDVISAAKFYCGNPNVALSGYSFTQEVYDRLINVGVAGIYISLNGSTEKINSQSRDGYSLAIDAMELLKSNDNKNVHINWVMHKSNSDDFENIIDIAENYNISEVVIMAVKPDSKKQLLTVPTYEQMISVRDKVRAYHGDVKISVETCYSPMLALLSDTKLFGNFNTGFYKGCMAGKAIFSVNVDGLLSPCRHLEYFEKYDTIEDYWNNSQILKCIRDLDESQPEEMCCDCKYMNYCRSCLAINSKIDSRLYRGNRFCPIYEKQ